MTATQPLTETTVLANDVKMPTIGFRDVADSHQREF